MHITNMRVPTPRTRAAAPERTAAALLLLTLPTHGSIPTQIAGLVRTRTRTRSMAVRGI
jgi:hypothetical protein